MSLLEFSFLPKLVEVSILPFLADTVTTVATLAAAPEAALTVAIIVAIAFLVLFTIFGVIVLSLNGKISFEAPCIKLEFARG